MQGVRDACSQAGVVNDRGGTFEPEMLRGFIREQICPWCGEGPWVRLSKHTHHAHGYGADDLRAMAQLPDDATTCSEEHTEQVHRAQSMQTPEGRRRAGSAAFAARDPEEVRQNARRVITIVNAERRAKPICEIHGDEYSRIKKMSRNIQRECGECVRAYDREHKRKSYARRKTAAENGDPDALAWMAHYKQTKRRAKQEKSRAETAV